MLRIALISLLVLALSIIPATAAGPETPWRSNEHGTLTVNVNTNWLGGYKFIPQVDGQITKLAAFGNGNKTIYLWDDANVGSSTIDNDPVRSVSVMASNAWVYGPVAPYPVLAGRTYVVGVYNLGGGSFRTGTNLPATYGSIRILHSCTASTVIYPTTCAAGWSGMYGQADIEFVAGSLPTPTPTATPIPTPTGWKCSDGITPQLPHPSLPTLWYCPVDGVVYYHG